MITSQNRKQVTGHAGKTRKFYRFDIDDNSKQILDKQLIELPKEMSLHEYHGDEHPVYEADWLITGGCGEGFKRRMANHSVRVRVTDTTSIDDALTELLTNTQ
jgi:predicted Fe-Mo cluster-binding NifX family protein